MCREPTQSRGSGEDISPSSLVLYLSASGRHVYLLQSFQTSLVESQGLRVRKCCLGMPPRLLPGLGTLDRQPHFSELQVTSETMMGIPSLWGCRED